MDPLTIRWSSRNSTRRRPPVDHRLGGGGAIDCARTKSHPGGALAKEKGYSFFGNFLLGLVFGMFALIYQAGRPVSYERECVMQDRLAIQTAKELYKLQRAREKAQTSSVPKVPVR